MPSSWKGKAAAPSKVNQELVQGACLGPKASLSSLVEKVVLLCSKKHLAFFIPCKTYISVGILGHMTSALWGVVNYDQGYSRSNSDSRKCWSWQLLPPKDLDSISGNLSCKRGLVQDIYLNLCCIFSCCSTFKCLRATGVL